MSTTRPDGPPSRPNRRKAPEQRKSPLQKPKGVGFVTITACLVVLLGITLFQAACSTTSATSAASPSASASAAPTPSSAPSAGASALASASAKPSPSIQRTFASPPPMTIDVSKTYTATIQTEKGNIVMQLDPKLAPLTVNNFVFLANQHFYDGLTWHRVVPDFVIQGGDPVGNGSGGPGYKFKDELPKSSDVYAAGAVAMANSGPNTNGSQFFICTVDDTTKLQPLYSYFGHVVQGLDIAQQIKMGDHLLKVTIS